MTFPIRLALVSAFPPGRQSLNEYGLHLAQELAARHDVEEVIVLADKLPETAVELDLGPKIRVDRVWRFNSLLTGPAILRALRRNRADAVLWNLQTATFGDHEIPAAAGLTIPAVAKGLGWPSGVIAHNIIAGVDLEETVLKGQPIRQFLVQTGGALITRILMAANYTTVTLRSYAEHLSKACPNADIHVVPHGTFDTMGRQISPLAERPKRIVTMGKFGTYKRLETLLHAFDILRSNPDFSDYQLIIGGSDHPNTPGYLRDLADQHRQDIDVVFHGYVAEDDIPAFFGDARLSVFDYSSTTGSSGVLHQSASYGALPIFPQIGDFVDVCRDENLHGANYAPGDAESMASAMAQMLGDLDHAQRIARSNKMASQEFPLSDIAGFHVNKLSTILWSATDGERATS